MGINRVPMAPHGLILSEDGATGSRMLFRWVLGLPDVKIRPFWVKIDPRGSRIQISPYFPIEVALSIFLKKERAGIGMGWRRNYDFWTDVQVQVPESRSL